MKISLAVAALLGISEAVNVAHAPNTDVEEQLVDLEESLELELQEKSKVSSLSGAKCKDGVKRFTSGADNTWSTFKAAVSGSAQFVDKGFPTDITSLVWEDYIP
jgi:hypothetical protein